MTAIDREYVLGLLNQAHNVQQHRTEFYAKRSAALKILTAETRSYSVALLIDALNEGLLEQLHAEAEQRLYVDVAAAEDDAWTEYQAGVTTSLLSTTPLAIAFGDALPQVTESAAKTPGRPQTHVLRDVIDQEQLELATAPAPAFFMPGDIVNVVDGTGARYSDDGRRPGIPIEGLRGKVTEVGPDLVTLNYDNLGSTLSLPPAQLMHFEDWITTDIIPVGAENGAGQ